MKQRTSARDRVSFLFLDREVKLTQIKGKGDARLSTSKNERIYFPSDVKQ